MEAVSTKAAPAEEQVVPTLSPLPRWHFRPWICYLLIGLISFAVWIHTIRFQFVWDDQQFIQELQSIRSLKNVPEMFYSLEAQSSFPKGFVLFRPLRTLHYAILYWVGGQTEPAPWIYHLANVLWHCALALLLFSVLTQLFGPRKRIEIHLAINCPITPALSPSGRGGEPAVMLDRVQLVALLVSIGFAVQPVVTEVVCWAKSLDDIMATVFTLAATRVLLKWDGRNRQSGWALLYFLLAVYSKESAVPFAFVAFVLFWQFHKLSFRQSAVRSAGFMLIAFVFLVHRHLVIGRSSQTAPISGSYGQTLIDMLPVVPKYLRLLCGLPPFFIDYSYMPGHYSAWSPSVITGAALLLAMIASIVWCWRVSERAATGDRSRAERFQLVGFGLLWIGLFLLPVSNLVPMMQYMAERFLYLPLIGWLIVLGALLLKIERQRLAAIVSALVLLFWIALSWQRSSIWKDELTLFVRSSQEGPKTLRVEQNAVAAIFHLPQIRKLFLFDKETRKLQTSPGISREQAQRALPTLAEAQRLFPQDENISTALGITYSVLGRTNEALRSFELATQQNPHDANFWSNLAIARLEMGQINQAREAVEKALALDSGNMNALRSAARLYWETKDFPAALAVLKQLQQREPANQDHAYWILQVQQKLAQTPRE